MSPMKIIRGRRVITERGCEPASLHVRGGRIEAVAAYDDAPAGSPIVDAGEAIVMPGLVDSHVHVNEPGRTDWEGFSTATRAAAAGGITTLVDMPLNAIPPTTTVEGLRQKRNAASVQCFVDVAFWGGVVPDNEHEIEPLLREGVCGFKCFTIDSGVDEFPAVTTAHIRRALEILAPTGAPLLVHAEHPDPIAEAEAASDSIHAADPRDFSSFLATRPARAEAQAIELLADLAAETGGRVHIVHLAAASAVEILDRARARGAKISAETCPHYLALAAEDIPRGATEYKCAPPIRERENRDRLWESLDRGAIEMVVSDHSPCTPALKQLKSGNFLCAWGGISSVQLSLPVTWTEASARGHSLESLVAWMAAAPAKLAGLKAKGALAPGYDADVVFFDPDAVAEVDPAKLYHRHPITPYAGRPLRGAVQKTFLRGELVYDRGQLVAEPIGQILRP
jgi:allantoinase